MPVYFPLRSKLSKAGWRGASWVHALSLLLYVAGIYLLRPFIVSGLVIAFLLGGLFGRWYESIVPCVASAVVPLLVVFLWAAARSGVEDPHFWLGLTLMFSLSTVCAAAGWALAWWLRRGEEE